MKWYLSIALTLLKRFVDLGFVLQEYYEERHREPRLTLRPPSLAAPYAPIQNWHHQPEKLIFESCAYEANVGLHRSVFQITAFKLKAHSRLLPPQQYLGSMLIKDLRGTESTQDACAKMRVSWSFAHIGPAVQWRKAIITTLVRPFWCLLFVPSEVDRTNEESAHNHPLYHLQRGQVHWCCKQGWPPYHTLHVATYIFTDLN